MKKLDLGQTLTILANVGVVAGIVFLAFELRQNNEFLQLQADSDRRQRVNAVVELVINNPEYVELMAKDEAELSEVERDKLIFLGIRLLQNSEDVYRDVTLGRVDPEDAIRSVRGVWHRERLNYGAPLAWAYYTPAADPDFILWMEDHIFTEVSSE